MIRRLLFFLFLVAMTTSSYAQDMIIRKTGDTINCKIIERSPGEIKFQKVVSGNTNEYVLLGSDATLIRYADGRTDSLADVPAPLTQAQGPLVSDTYLQGMQDAKKNYHGSGSAATGTLIVSLISPLGGIIPAIACSSTIPKLNNLGYTTDISKHSPEYISGFLNEAHKMKQRRVWSNWGIAFSINLVLAAVLLSK